MLSLTQLIKRFCQSILVCVGTTLVLLAMAGLLSAEEPTESAAELSTRIDRLIKQLGDERVELRKEAILSLVKIGQPAVTPLTAAAKDAGPEVSQRATNLLNLLARARVGLRFVSQVTNPGLNGAVTVVFSPDGKQGMTRSACSRSVRTASSRCCKSSSTV